MSGQVGSRQGRENEAGQVDGRQGQENKAGGKASLPSSQHSTSQRRTHLASHLAVPLTDSKHSSADLNGATVPASSSQQSRQANAPVQQAQDSPQQHATAFCMGGPAQHGLTAASVVGQQAEATKGAASAEPARKAHIAPQHTAEGGESAAAAGALDEAGERSHDQQHRSAAAGTVNAALPKLQPQATALGGNKPSTSGQQLRAMAGTALKVLHVPKPSSKVVGEWQRKRSSSASREAQTPAETQPGNATTAGDALGAATCATSSHAERDDRGSESDSGADSAAAVPGPYSQVGNDDTAASLTHNQAGNPAVQHGRQVSKAAQAVSNQQQGTTQASAGRSRGDIAVGRKLFQGAGAAEQSMSQASAGRGYSDSAGGRKLSQAPELAAKQGMSQASEGRNQAGVMGRGAREVPVDGPLASKTGGWAGKLKSMFGMTGRGEHSPHNCRSQG